MYCQPPALSGSLPASAAEGISAMFRGSYVDDGEWIDDNRVSVGLDSPVIAMLAPFPAPLQGSERFLCLGYGHG